MTWDMRELKELLVEYYREERGVDLPLYPTDKIERMAEMLAAPGVADWLIARSKKTPYIHLNGYMERDWLFNPYPTHEEKQALKAQGIFEPVRETPSGRIHHILRKDLDCFPHDHPWDAQTIILRGWYRELRLLPDGSEQEFLRVAGDTASLNFGEFHRIIEVSKGGVWTLFITHQYQGTWGFLVDGKKVPYRQYLGLE